MLVLTRKLGEEIVIGDNIVISVLSVGRDRVKLGIAAPADVPIIRQEVQMRMGQADARWPLHRSACFADCA